MMPDGLQPVWHFHNSTKLAPGCTGEMEIAPLRGQQGLLASKLRNKPQVSAGLPRNCNLNSASTDLPKIAHKRSEEHTSELQSRENLVCRLLLEKKKLLNNLN